MGSRILLADDEAAITSELEPLLAHCGFEVAVARDGEEALSKAATFKPDLIVLDVLMPRLDGREACRRLRAAGNWTPVLMLTQVGNSTERALSLQEGADDYLNKPFDPMELVARIQAILRRAHTGSRPSAASRPLAACRRLTSGPLTLDRPSRRALLAGREVVLTAKAFALLEYLMLHPGEVIRRERLLDEIWGWDYPVATRAVDVRIAELRKALHDDAGAPLYVETRVNEGYCFVGDVEGSA